MELMETRKHPLLTLLSACAFALAATAGAAQEALPPPEQPVATASERPSIADMVEQVTPAVVNIAVTGTAQMPQNPLLNDPFFRRFFGVPPEQMPEAMPTMSVGSGVIIDAEEGYVLTNHHVIENAEQIEVTLRDRRQVQAQLIGSDPATDVALLRVEAGNLTALPLADSDALRIGDFVVAIGNPFGIGQTVTSGIVSALSRETGIIGEGGFEDFIQTDASINPGNSGGALVDYNGNLVGLNTAIIGTTGGNVGIGFAVPINMAMAVANQLLEFGEVRRGMLGVLIQDLTPEGADILGLDVTNGAVVSQVQPGSAAAEAGIEPGDVITQINGRRVQDSSDLRNVIGLMRPGAEVEVTLLREGDERSFEVALGGAPSPEAVAEAPQDADNILEGAQLADAPPAAGAEGAVITSIEEGSRAWRNGLREGDVIVELNNEEIESAEEARELVQGLEGGAALRVLRDNQPLFLVVG